MIPIKDSAAGRKNQSTILMRRKLGFLIALLLCYLASSIPVLAATEAEIVSAIGQLRNSQPIDDRAAQAVWNARMDGAWTTLRASPSQSAPLVRRELALEIKKQDPDQFFLLDTAYLSMALDRASAVPLALQALAKIDPTAKIIRYNDQELFNFTYDLAKTGDVAVRALIDRLFLSSFEGRQIFIPQHVFTVTPELMATFLYGVTGADAEGHLARLLTAQPDMRVKLLEVLYFLGSEESVPSIAETLSRYGDNDTVARGITVLMTVGGPKGQEVVMKLDSAGFDHEAKKYLASVRKAAPEVSLKSQAKALERFTGSVTKLSDTKLKERLELMYQNFGKDDELSPSVILKSSLPSAFLIGEMKRVRSRMFFRLNQHALEDVQVTNLIINALQYRQ